MVCCAAVKIVFIQRRRGEKFSNNLTLVNVAEKDIGTIIHKTTGMHQPAYFIYSTLYMCFQATS